MNEKLLERIIVAVASITLLVLAVTALVRWNEMESLRKRVEKLERGYQLDTVYIWKKDLTMEQQTNVVTAVFNLKAN